MFSALKSHFQVKIVLEHLKLKSLNLTEVCGVISWVSGEIEWKTSDLGPWYEKIKYSADTTILQPAVGCLHSSAEAILSLFFVICG